MDDNPYQAGRMAADEADHPADRHGDLGAFVKTFVIMDLVFACLRAPFLVLAVIGMMGGMVDDALAATVPFEIAGHAGLFVFGVSANVLILLKKAAGLVLGWILVGVTVLSYLVGLAQIAAQTVGADSQAELIGMWVGGIITILIRVALLVCYCVALLMAARVIKSSATDTQTMTGAGAD